MIKYNISIISLRAMIVCCFAALIFTACDEDSFTQVVTIKIPEHEPKIAMSALWLSGDSIPFVHINESRGILEDDFPNPPSDATVKLFLNGSLLKEAEFNENGAVNIYANPNTYIFPQEFVTLNPGDEYRLETSLRDLPVASATQIMPSVVDIDQAEYKPQSISSPDGELMDAINVTFTDPADTEDYYRIAFFRLVKRPDWSNPEDSITDFNMAYLDANDPTIIATGGVLVFSDKSFNGKTATIQGQTYQSWGSVQNSEVHLTHITKEAYYYLKSRGAYSEARDNPFAQPVTVYTNIEDGFGVFGLGNDSKMEL